MLTKLNTKRLFWILVIFIFLLLLHYSKIIRPVENVFFKLTSPIRQNVYKSSRGISSYFYSIFNYKTIKSEDDAIRDQLSKYLIDKSYIKKLEDENKTLRESLNYKRDSKKDIVLAEVISGFYMGNKSIVTINKGKKDGIDVGMPVVYGQGVIIGTIISLEEARSNILLLSDRNSILTVFIQGDEKLSGIVKGDLDYGLEMDYIPLDSSIKEGDMIITSGLEEKIPRGLVIGQIKKLLFNEGDFFKRAVVYSPIDYQMLDLVSVIKK